MEMYKRFEEEWLLHWWNGLTSTISDYHLKCYVGYLVMNPNLTWEIMHSHPEINRYCSIIINHKIQNYMLSGNPNFTWDFIKRNPQINWNYGILSRHLPWENIRDNPHKAWCDYDLSTNPHVTWEIVQSNPDHDWSYYLLSANPNITWDIIMNNPEKEWNMSSLASNPNITWEFIQRQSGAEWEYAMSDNPNVTWEIVQAHPEKNWYYNLLSKNPNISWEIVKNNPDKDWNKLFLLENGMEKTKEKFILNKYREFYQQYMLKCVLPELIDLVFHPDNFCKLYGLGHFENKY